MCLWQCFILSLIGSLFFCQEMPVWADLPFSELPFYDAFPTDVAKTASGGTDECKVGQPIRPC